MRKSVFRFCVCTFLSSALALTPFASSVLAAELKIKETIEEEYKVKTYENLEESGYEEHEAVTTYYSNGSFTIKDKVKVFDLDDNLIDSYTLHESSTPKTKGKKKIAVIAGEKEVDGEAIEEYSLELELPTADELEETIKKWKPKKNKRVSLDEGLQKKIKEQTGARISPNEVREDSEPIRTLGGGTTNGHGNNYYSYNLSTHEYTLQTLSAAPYLYFIVVDDRDDLDEPSNWDGAMGKMDIYASEMAELEDRRDEDKVADWVDVVAAWVAVYGISAGPPGWAAAATATVITALNSIYKVANVSSNEGSTAKNAAKMLDQLANYVAWGYVRSENGSLFFEEIR